MAGYFHFMNQGIVCCIILTSFSSVEDRHLNFSFITKELLLSSYQESLQMIDKALFHSSQGRNTARSVVHMMSTFPRQAEPETQEISRAAEVFTTTLQVLKDKTSLRYKRDTTASELLSWEDVELIAELSGCPPATHHAMCLQQHHVNKYRSISGLCNNRQNPLWGASNTPLSRWLPAEYEDGETQPKGWSRGRLHNGFQLPLVREVSRNIVRSSHKHKDSMYSQMLVEWGQYIDHDMTFTPQSVSKAAFKGGADCLSTCENVHPCFPIQMCGVLSGGKTCMPFFRSSAACPTSVVSDIKGALQRQQMNAITSFIDASVVYGHTPKLQHSLRELSGPDGRLAVNHQFKDPNDRAYLPFVRGVPSACLQAPGGGGGGGAGAPGTRPHPRVECFRAGDSRVNEALGLLALHTLWLREHNRVAAALTRLNAHWSAETAYQETRKIIGALHQIITMRDYVPKIVGLKSLEEYIGPYGGYDPTVDPSASNVFATAAFRFGHATINPVLRRLNESFQEDQRFPSLNLEHTFFSPWRIVQQGGIEPVLRGVMGTAAAAMSPEQLVSEEVTERLLVLDAPHRMDLASLNLQRGRDHALPGYNAWRAFCGLKRIDTQEDFQGVVRDARVVEEIMKLYKHPDNIDVWLGGLVEDLLPGSRTGPLFACLIGKQMKVLRDGDRFWWEAEGVFTEHQRAELSKWSLSRIICDNSDMREVPRDAFKLGSFPADLLPCHRIPSLNLDAWREDSTTGNQDFQEMQTTNPPFYSSGDVL